MHPKILFDHIPKCAGSSVRGLLERGFGPDRVAPFIQWLSVGNASRLFSRYDVITGHFSGPILIDLPFPVRRLTVVRDPVDRILSLYHYLQQAPDAAIVSGDVAAMSFEEFVASRDQRFMASVGNLLCIHFADALGMVTDPASLLPMAKEAVDRYDLVGLYEDLDTTTARICRLCDLSDAALPTLNMTPVRQRREDLDPAVVRFLEEKNRLDTELYRYIAERFRREDTARATARPPGAPASGLIDGSRLDFGTRGVSIDRIMVAEALSGGAVVASGGVLKITASLSSRIDERDLVVCLILSDMFGDHVYGTDTMLLGRKYSIAPGQTLDLDIRFPANLGSGTYRVSLVAYCGARFTEKVYHHWAHNAATFQVLGNVGDPFFGAVKLNATIALT